MSIDQRIGSILRWTMVALFTGPTPFLAAGRMIWEVKGPRYVRQCIEVEPSLFLGGELEPLAREIVDRNQKIDFMHVVFSAGSPYGVVERWISGDHRSLKTWLQVYNAEQPARSAEVIAIGRSATLRIRDRNTLERHIFGERDALSFSVNGAKYEILHISYRRMTDAGNAKRFGPESEAANVFVMWKGGEPADGASLHAALKGRLPFKRIELLIRSDYLVVSTGFPWVYPFADKVDEPLQRSRQGFEIVCGDSTGEVWCVDTRTAR